MPKLTPEQKAKKQRIAEKLKLRNLKAKTKKQQGVSVLKKKLWKIVSEYIRRKYSNDSGMVQCVTCGITKHWKEMQAGHWIPAGSSNYLRYVENNIHPQCYGCNVGKHSNPIEYRAFMEKTYGINFINEMLSLRNEIKKNNTPELLEMIDVWEGKLLTLKK